MDSPSQQGGCDSPSRQSVKNGASWPHLLADILGAILFIGFIFFAIFKIKADDQDDSSARCLTVRTHAGVIKGTLVQFRIKGQTYSTVAFYGIPFAAPPTGPNRFAEPMCAKPWRGVFNATYKRPPCAQFDTNLPKNYTVDSSNTTEDCLHINIWVPGSCVYKARGYAVVFWLYGGSFVSGGNSYDWYDGRFVAGLGDVVVAVPNYRVSIFGYLNSGTEDLPGNLGLHDQLLAARWLRANAEYFGGDNERILAAGQSAGAISFTLLMISPLVSQYGPFRRFYLMSASAKMPLPQNRDASARQGFADIVEKSGCHAGSVADSLGCIRHVNMSTLLQAAGQSSTWFVPSIPGSLIPGSVNDLLKRFLPSRARDAIITVTATEGTAFFEMLLPDYVGTRKPITIKMLKSTFPHLFAGVNESLMERMISLLGTKYDLKDPDHKGWIDIIGDVLFRCPILSFGKSLAETGQKVYHMVYTHKPSFTVFSAKTATHGDDAPMLFGLPFLYPYLATEKDREISYSMIITLTNFAKNGSVPMLVDGTPWPLFSEATHYPLVDHTIDGYALGGPSPDCDVAYVIEKYLSEMSGTKSPGTSILKSVVSQALMDRLASIPALAQVVSGRSINATRFQ